MPDGNCFLFGYLYIHLSLRELNKEVNRNNIYTEDVTDLSILGYDRHEKRKKLWSRWWDKQCRVRGILTVEILRIILRK